MSYKPPMTVSGHRLPEVVSALQKSIRRGLVDDALYFASEMHLSGFVAYLWRRLFVIASEDVGIANPDAVVQVRALYENFQDLLKHYPAGPKKRSAPERLMVVQAVIVLATSRKSRLVDDALVVHYWNHDALHRDIPDYAYDRHTSKGKAKGRGGEHFAEEGGKLAPTGTDHHPWIGPEGIANPYARDARELEDSGKVNRIPPADKEVDDDSDRIF